jgi:uncharacterized protein YbjT (DUF2867 family)
MKTAIVIGSTGLIGTELVKQLESNPYYEKIILLNRKPSGIKHAKVEERIINFDAPDLNGINGEDVFCAIGTTIRKAGSKAAQHKIDCEYPSTLAALLKPQGAKQFLLVSSIGADENASNFYLRTKGELEKNIQGLGFETTIIIRPSILLGKRKEFRLGEKIGIVLIQLLSPLMLGSFKKYRGVKDAKVAAKMIASATSGIKGLQIIESDKIN